MRDQEVLRANRELSAYFKGRRTEREARAALKTIKSFVRDRERMDPKSRPALPGGRTPSQPKGLTTRQAKKESGARSRTPRHAREKLSRKASAPIEPTQTSLVPPESDEPTP